MFLLVILRLSKLKGISIDLTFLLTRSLSGFLFCPSGIAFCAVIFAWRISNFCVSFLVLFYFEHSLDSMLFSLIKPFSSSFSSSSILSGGNSVPFNNVLLSCRMNFPSSSSQLKPGEFLQVKFVINKDLKMLSN